MMMIPSEPKNVAIWNADKKIDFPLLAGFVLFLLYILAYLRLKIKATCCIFSFYVLLTLHFNIMIVFFFTNLIHKFFILIHLLHSSTCFEHYCAHLQEDNCINTASGIVKLFG